MHDETLRRCGIKVRDILMMIGTPQKPGRGVPLTQHISTAESASGDEEGLIRETAQWDRSVNPE
jgi:hypothetical protein